MTSFVRTYDLAQLDLPVITPSLGKRICLWQVIAESPSNVKLEFKTSMLKIVDVLNGSIHADNIGVIGAVDEPLSLTCGAGTTIKILYDEV